MRFIKEILLGRPLAVQRSAVKSAPFYILNLIYLCLKKDITRDGLAVEAVEWVG